MFQPVSEAEVREIVTKSPNKSCDLDPLPTWLLKKYMDQLLPLIIAIKNRSMDESMMPLCFKLATITPLLNRYGSDEEEMKNYRPISNLPFVSKLIEKVTPRRIADHLEHNDIQNSFRGHSTDPF